MLHQPASAYYRARTPEFLLEVEELHKVREMITRVYALKTGKPFWIGRDRVDGRQSVVLPG